MTDSLAQSLVEAAATAMREGTVLWMSMSDEDEQMTWEDLAPRTVAAVLDVLAETRSAEVDWLEDPQGDLARIVTEIRESPCP